MPWDDVVKVLRIACSNTRTADISASSNQVDKSQIKDTQPMNTERIQETQSSEIPITSAKTTSTIKDWRRVILAVIEFTHKKVVPWLWAAVIVVVIIPLIGELFIAKAFETKPLPQIKAQEGVTKAKPTDWKQIEKAVHRGLEDARQSAEDYASKELDAWVNDLMERVDSSFLDWYFDYFNQKQIEYKALFGGMSANMAHWLNPNSQAPEERVAEMITEDFQTEFAKRVLRPQISQIRLEQQLLMNSCYLQLHPQVIGMKLSGV